MPYYKDDNNKIFFYETDADKNKFNPSLVEITEEEKESILNPAPTQGQLKEYLASYRYNVEVGGISVGSVNIQTDRQSRSDLIAARIKAVEDNTYSVLWKTPAGFVELDASTLILIADAVENHVQNCFRAEKNVLDNFNFTDFDEVRSAYDDALSAL